MRIKIAQRYHPFSHLPGIKCVLPGTPYRLQIFPALIKAWDLSGSAIKECGEIPIAFEGPVDDFTVQADLEKGNITVSGKTVKGYGRYHLEMSLEGIRLAPEKGPALPQILPLRGMQMRTPPGSERLSLGCHKAQNWDLARHREDLAEIFPIWLKLGQMTPHPGSVSFTEPSLLALCENPDDPCRAFLNLYKAGFEGIMSPRSVDEQFQGFPLPPLPHHESSLALLAQGAALIRKLFFIQKENIFAILPHLPYQFHCGRMTGINAGNYGTIDVEWSKKQARRLIFEASAIGEVRFIFQTELKTMRLMSNSHPKGIRIASSSIIDIRPGERYLLDRFEH